MSQIFGGGGGAPPGTFNIKIIELDFGATRTERGEWTVNDVDVLAGSDIMCQLAVKAPTGRDEDEAEMEPMYCFADNIQAGSFVFNALTFEGPVDGLYKFNYLIG